MTRQTVDRLADRAMVLVEGAGYLLALAPLLLPWGLFRGVAASCGILAIALLMGYARRQTVRVNGLRKTLNEAIVHDLKNPMTAIMGCLTCIVDEDLTTAQREKLLNLALHGCRSQMTLVETLVDTSRLEHGELLARKEFVKTQDLLRSCLADVRGVAAHLGVDLREDVAGAVPEEFSCDPDLLPRTIANLLHNAIKYTPPGGRVSLSVRAENGLTFEINDTGIGIPAQHIGRIFGKYYRVEGADQSTRRGSGLGLYFCRLVIEAHGGKVSIRSQLGRGTTIAFNIPQASGGVKRHGTSRQIARKAQYA